VEHVPVRHRLGQAAPGVSTVIDVVHLVPAPMTVARHDSGGIGQGRKRRSAKFGSGSRRRAYRLMN
jgi:hypothetical protein